MDEIAQDSGGRVGPLPREVAGEGEERVSDFAITEEDDTELRATNAFEDVEEFASSDRDGTKAGAEALVAVIAYEADKAPDDDDKDEEEEEEEEVFDDEAVEDGIPLAADFPLL